MKLKTWGGEQFSQKTDWKFTEVPSIALKETVEGDVHVLLDVLAVTTR